MNVSIVTAPVGYPISEEEARDHLRLDDDRDDAYLKGLISVVTDITQKVTRRSLLTQTWKVFFDCFPEYEFELPFAPLQSVTHVKYYDANDVLQTVSSANYIVDAVREPGRITTLHGQWPIANYRPNAVEIQYICGYGKADQVPYPIKQAMLIMLSHMYENREPVVVGTNIMPMPMSYEYLLWPYRVLRFF